MRWTEWSSKEQTKWRHGVLLKWACVYSPLTRWVWSTKVGVDTQNFCAYIGTPLYKIWLWARYAHEISYYTVKLPAIDYHSTIVPVLTWTTLTTIAWGLYDVPLVEAANDEAIGNTADSAVLSCAVDLLPLDSSAMLSFEDVVGSPLDTVGKLWGCTSAEDKMSNKSLG